MILLDLYNLSSKIAYIRADFYLILLLIPGTEPYQISQEHSEPWWFTEIHRSGIHMFDISKSKVYQAFLTDLIMMASLFAFLRAEHLIEEKCYALRKILEN